METRILPDPVRTQQLNTAELRESFLVEGLFQPGEVKLVYTMLDRLIVGSAVPTSGPLELTGGKELAAECFAERREVGVINIGGPGAIEADDQSFALGQRDAVYIGRGTRSIRFTSADASEPARFYIASLPAHAVHPSKHITPEMTESVTLGSQEGANERTIHKYIAPGIVDSCQLVMGITTLSPGNVWNTMPCHTHQRRVEAYMYFDFPADHAVFHFMGEPTETRHLVIRPGEVALSPSWSIHGGAGTVAYRFIWAMGGENQAFDDMDHVPMSEVR